jgi:hypothetical protein
MTPTQRKQLNALGKQIDALDKERINLWNSKGYSIGNDAWSHDTEYSELCEKITALENKQERIMGTDEASMEREYFRKMDRIAQDRYEGTCD